ncbi:MAG: precorrin-2 C(20)-methyltransferase, partial [Pseudomonadota bacterium]|nr:precorrin-2 C(20)-methyltransferase [Pseudomonadota bacterium]
MSGDAPLSATGSGPHPGTLHGLGLGPGDPELMTLKAVRLIRSCPVIAYPAPDSGESFARSIAAEFIPQGAEEIPIVIPMRAARDPAQAVYDRAAEALAQRLAAGRDVAVLCEGDPFFYGSFMYLFARLSARFPTQVVPGVSSLTASAAAAGRPLVARDAGLAVLPGTLPEAALAARLRAMTASGGGAAILKVGRRLPRLRALLAAEGLAERAVYVGHATLAGQVVAP